MARGWSDLLRSLGQSVIEVVRAEATALREDLAESGRRVTVAGGLAAVAAFCLFWAVGAAGFAAHQILVSWLPGWAAALIVLAVFILLGLIFALLARRRLMAIEVPADTVRRRMEDHVAWWQGELLSGGDWPETDRLIEDDIDDD